MTSIPLGVGAYKRTYSGAPEIKLENRYAERQPTNLVEHTALIGRPGSTLLNDFDGETTITMTIASPAVVTWTGHELLAGDAIVFATTGALPTGVTAGTTYYVLSTSLTANTFKFAATAGGTAINTSGSQSGTHTAAMVHTDGANRGNYYHSGLFDDDLFVVEGHKFYRYSSDGTQVLIGGVVYESGHPYVSWSKGEGYEYLFIADGLLLQYYDGGSRAVGTLTVSTSTPPNIASQVIQIGEAYYSWSATPDAGTPDGSSANPWLALLGANDADSLTSMANLIKYAGIPGTDFSSALPGPNLDYTAESTATTLVITSLRSNAAANAIATTVFSGSDLSWGAATLTGGNVHSLVQIETPDGVAIKALSALAGFVLASVGNSRKFFWIEPGDVTIDALNFAEKESQPDDIEDMLTVSDQVFIAGGGSSEWWYATGDADAPFAPTKGLAYQRGVLPGSPVVVKAPSGDTVILVGNDNIVYSVGAGGAVPISDAGITERIRTQVRREAGLT